MSHPGEDGCRVSTQGCGKRGGKRSSKSIPGREGGRYEGLEVRGGLAHVKKRK